MKSGCSSCFDTARSCTACRADLDGQPVTGDVGTYTLVCLALTFLYCTTLTWFHEALVEVPAFAAVLRWVLSIACPINNGVGDDAYRMVGPAILNVSTGGIMFRVPVRSVHMYSTWWHVENLIL